MLLGIAAPSWGQFPYRPFGGSRTPLRQTLQQNYGFPSYGGYQLPGYGRNQLPGYGGYQMPGYGGNQMPGYGGYPLPGYGGNQLPGYGGYQAPGQLPAAQDDGRHLWVYGSRGEGSFRDMGDGTWVESNNTGQFRFRETARTAQFIDLFDPTRNAFARLTDRVMYHHGLGDPNWHQGYIGQWQ